jgi:cell division protein FtsQ
MWDKPQVLFNVANSLLGTSLLLVCFGTVHYAVHLPQFSLNTVRLVASPQRVETPQIEEILRSEIRGNFFTVDLEDTRKAFEKLPWVRKVTVRRHFPWQLEVELEEHKPLATWNGTELVNTHGELFAVENGTEIALPKFIGQPDTAVQVARMYHIFGEQLADLGESVEQISLSPRRAWQLRLNNGMVLELGRELAQERLARFVAAYPGSLGTLQKTVNYVDLRYRNGFAAYLPEGMQSSR